MIDLHTHTTHSDGSQTVAELLRRAENQGLKYLSITDHNSVGAYLDDLQNPEIRKIFSGKIITGIEIAFEHDGVSNEVLGYGIDANKIAPSPLLDKNHNFNKQLTFLEGTYAKLKEFGFVLQDLEVFKTAMKTCPSIRQLLKNDVTSGANKKIATELCQKYNRTDVMDFLANEFVQPTGKFHVPRGKDTIEQASSAIKDAGGLVFMAHPFRVKEKDIIRLLDYARTNNIIDGIEVYYPEHTEEQIEFLEKYCKKHNLLKSGGSDSHHASHPLSATPQSKTNCIAKLQQSDKFNKGANKMETDEIIDYYIEAVKIRDIERFGIWPKKFRNNVAEHCFMMIILADKLIEHYDLKLDFRKVVRYIYLHDWGEIGMKNDICAPVKVNCRATAKEQERIAAHNSLEKFGLKSDIETYDGLEDLQDDEARFVSAIDKLECPLYIIKNGLDKIITSVYKNGKFEHKVFKTVKDVIDFETNYPKRAIDFYPPLKDFAEAIMKRMKDQASKLKF